MGEATFYLVGEFPKNTNIELVQRFLSIIAKNLVDFQEEFQNIRWNAKETVLKRHKTLINKFPILKKYIRFPKPVVHDLNMNYLAGFCDMTEYSILVDEVDDILKIILYAEVWHFADWTELVTLLYKLGAIRATFYSDEYVLDIVQDSRLTEQMKRPKEIELLSKDKIMEEVIISEI